MTSHASLRIGLAALSVALSGCGPEAVDARAIWVDDFGGPGQRRIHIYDRGDLDEIEVLGASEAIERVRLDPRGRGVLVRTGDRGAWFDLDDGRRLPLQLPPSSLGGQPRLAFAEQALTWIDPGDGSVVVVPLAMGLPLARRADGTMQPLTRAIGSGLGAGAAWTVAASRAPVLFTGAQSGTRASFLRYPERAGQALVIALEATAEGLTLPASARESRTCATNLGCYAQVSVDAEGERAIFADDIGGPWQQFEGRSPATAGPLELPEALADAQLGSGLRLLQVLDRASSIWIGAGQLYHYDRVEDFVDSLPLFASGPLTWFTVDDGRAVVLVSNTGPVYRADIDGLHIVNLETTTCVGADPPKVSPDGRWAAWTCVDADAEVTAGSGVVVRVSAAGLERFVGVPMATLAIDDHGDLLLYSVESILNDAVDGVDVTTLPRNLFVLERGGVLTRIDDLEPAPTPVLLATGELAAYIQGVALAGPS